VAGVSLPVISVIIPTVTGREDHFTRCISAYGTCSQGAYDLQLVVERDHPSCGAAWQAGLERAKGDYIHLTCDDIEPLPGWHVPAIEAVENGFLPAPQVYDPNGVPQSHPQPGVVGMDWAPVHMSALPFCSAGQMEKIAPLMTAHYFTDDFFSYRGIRQGWQCKLRVHYAFRHHWAQHRRGAGMSEAARMQLDQSYYIRAMEMVLAGQWNAPWPPNGGL
jgi:hypothetical protein